MVIVALVEGAFYVSLISGQGNELGWATAWVTALIILPIVASAVGAVSAPRLLRGLLLGFGFVGALGISALSLFSIGLLLLPLSLGALFLMIWRLGPLGRPEEWVAACLGGAIGFLAGAGYVWEQPFLPPACPSGVTASGNSEYPAGSLYGDRGVYVSWTCVKGRLVSWSHYP